jgi:hypothetical protein
MIIIIIFTESLGETIKDGIFNLVEQLGETTVDQQRDILSGIGTNTGYVAPKSHDVSHDMPAYSQEPVSTDIPKRQGRLIPSFIVLSRKQNRFMVFSQSVLLFHHFRFI